MLEGLITGLLLSISVLMGEPWPGHPMPEVEIISETQRNTTIGEMAVGGYNDKTKKIYLLDMDGQPEHLSLEEISTLAHELVHWVQDRKGYMEWMKEGGTFSCEVWFVIESEALDIEAQFRTVLGLPKDENRFAYFIIYQGCLQRGGFGR
jgi:hypothetical protein